MALAADRWLSVWRDGLVHGVPSADRGETRAMLGNAGHGSVSGVRRRPSGRWKGQARGRSCRACRPVLPAIRRGGLGNVGVSGWVQGVPCVALFDAVRFYRGASSARKGRSGGQSRASGPSGPCVGNPRPTWDHASSRFELFPSARRQGAPPLGCARAVGSGA